MIKERLEEAYHLLFNYFGPQEWWPGETSFEIAVGAILTQNTNWKNVEKAISNLKSNTDFSPKGLYSLEPNKLAELIKPAGYFRLKTKRLRNFLKPVVEIYDANLDLFNKGSTAEVRERLLNISGIGPETADSILLYAFNRPIFVIDTYTFRMLMRHNLCDESADYDELQSTFIDNMCEDIKLYNEFHALIVMLGKNFCKPKPKCELCPLKCWANGPNIKHTDCCN